MLLRSQSELKRSPWLCVFVLYSVAVSHGSLAHSFFLCFGQGAAAADVATVSSQGVDEVPAHRAD